jgi:hypothetical protein
VKSSEVSRSVLLRNAARRLRDTAPMLESQWADMADPVADWLDRHADAYDRIGGITDSPIASPEHPAWRIARKVMGVEDPAARNAAMLERTAKLADAYQKYDRRCQLHGSPTTTREEVVSILRTSSFSRSNFLHGMSVDFLLFAFKNGDETSWEEEFEWIRESNADNLRAVRDLVKAGKLPPVELYFREMRVIDGHHRILAHKELGFAIIPVSDAWDKE